MASWRYSRRSMSRLETCHEHLVRLMVEALAHPDCPSDISVIEGYRGRERQNELKAAGKSQLSYPNSKHNKRPKSLAVDVAPYVNGAISWEWEHFDPLAAHIKRVWAELLAAGRVSGSIHWGGDWRWRAGPHFEWHDE